MKIDQDSPRVRIPPPLLLLTSILIGVGLQLLYPIHLVSGLGRWLLGGLMLGLGVGTILFCAGKFRRAHTAIEPWKTSSQIITSGPYRWSRNPIYLSFTVVGAGIAILLNNLWIVLTQLPLVLVITQVVIRKEERYLEEKFGDSYRAYKSRVRRWI
jgi:protein-S-isoprenylcysteine O-methyltransferase Ste14